MTELLKNIYLCNSDGSYRQMVHTVSFKSLSSFFSHSGSSGMVFLCQKQNPGINRGKIINRSVSKIFDCVGLTKPRLISKLGNFCYLRFYAAILGNVAELTTLKKKTHKVLFTVPEMAINLQKEHCQSASFLLSFSCESMKKWQKNFRFLLSPFNKRGFYTFF